MGNPLIVFLLIIFIGLAGAQAPDESPFERVKRFFVKFDAVIETGDLTKISPLFSDEFLLEHCEALTFKQNLLQAISDYAEEQKKIYIKPVGAKKLDNSLIEITAQFGYLHSQEELEAFGFQSTWILHTTRDQLISGKAYCFVASTPTARPSNQATALTTSTTWTPSYSPTTVNPSDLTTRYWHETDDKSTVDWIIVNQLIELDHARTAANISALERLIDRNTDLDAFYFTNPTDDDRLNFHTVSGFLTSSQGKRYCFFSASYSAGIGLDGKMAIIHMHIYLLEVGSESPTGWRVTKTQTCADENCRPIML